ncbi:cysteine desulfurase [Candidatus Woesearchaeota archaeon]|nr:cysteine desulfurase [Candidatus Woesearchaeota archaeon]
MRREDFPILARKVNGHPLAYLDNASTSQKPKQVISAVSDFYENHNSNIHRGIHSLSEEATEMYEDSHVKVARFVNADNGEIIFTRNTTESINLLAYSLCLGLKAGDEILLTEMEHHSNLVPWQQIALKGGLKVRFARVDDSGAIDMEHFSSLLGKRTRIVSVGHVSNVLGTINPVREISKASRDNGSVSIIDAAQSVPHMPVDVKSLGCDFLAFSSHKMLGPTGVGVLYGKRHILESLPPFLFGGDMIRQVDFGNSRFNDVPWKFEAGTPDIAGAVGLGAAVDYLGRIGMDAVLDHGRKLSDYARSRLLLTPGIELYGPSGKRGSLLSFNLKGVHSHDVAEILDRDGIAVRAGHHCAMPLMRKLGITGAVRASFYLYNSKDEIDRLESSILRVRKVFSK